jgi:glutamine synthetase
LSAILAGVLYGIERKIDPGAPVKGDVYSSKAKTLPVTWDSALVVFEKSGFIAEYLGKDYRKVFSACKRQEQEQIAAKISDVEYDAYLRNV